MFDDGIQGLPRLFNFALRQGGLADAARSVQCDVRTLAPLDLAAVSAIQDSSLHYLVMNSEMKT